MLQAFHILPVLHSLVGLQLVHSILEVGFAAESAD